MFRVFSCLTTEHDWRLVVLAAVLCFFASLTAQSLFYRARLSRGRPRAYWSLAAGVAAGCGIWATHFIAMLAYEPGVPVAYNIGLTVLSLVVAVAMTAAGIGFAANGTERWRAPAGGAIVGIGVAFMHYLGMSALELPGRITWVPEIVVVSVTLGVVLSAASLAVAVRSTDMRSMLSAAVLLTLGIVSLHFTAMGAVEIIPDPTRIISAFSLRPTTLALAVAGVSLLMLALSLVGTMVDERFHSQRARLDAAINNMRHGLLMFDAQGQLLLYNRPYLELYGLSTKLANAGLRLRDLLRLRREVGTFGYDPDQFVHGIVDLCKIESNTMELPDGRTISIRNTPVQGGGWVSIHEDITERLRAEKELYRTKAFLDSVLENVPVTVVVKDARDKRYVFVNRSGEDFFGVPRDQIVGKTAHDLFSAEDAEAIDERDEQVLASGEEMLVENNPIETPGKGMRLVTTKRLANPRSGGQSAIHARGARRCDRA